MSSRISWELGSQVPRKYPTLTQFCCQFLLVSCLSLAVSLSYLNFVGVTNCVTFSFLSMLLDSQTVVPFLAFFLSQIGVVLGCFICADFLQLFFLLPNYLFIWLKCDLKIGFLGRGAGGRGGGGGILFFGFA